MTANPTAALEAPPRDEPARIGGMQPAEHRHDRVPAAATARRLYAMRGARSAAFGDDLFGEPAWDMLLDLFVSAADGRKLSVSAVCIGSRCSPATAHRYLVLLEESGIVARVPDAMDHRRHFVRLTTRGEAVMRGVLERF